MSDAKVPPTDKGEVSPAPDANQKSEVNPDNSELDALKSRLDAAEKAKAAAERKLQAADRKGKSADELQTQLERREEEWSEAQRSHEGALKQRDKLFQQVLKPRLEALPEHARELVKRAGKDSPESLLEALELAEKAAGTGPKEVKEPQGGPVPNPRQVNTLEDAKGNFDIYGGFTSMAGKAAKG